MPQFISLGSQILRSGVIATLLVCNAWPASSLASDDDLEVFLDGICQAGPLPVDVFIVCNNAFPAGSLAAEGGASAFSTSSNLGTAAAQGGLSSKLDGQNRLDDDDELLFEIDNDTGGWGLLLAAQTGATERKQTERENGYDSSLVGFVLGLDYLFADNLVVGGTLSQSDDDADFDGDAGELDTESQSLLVYLTWLPSANLGVDAYLGTADTDFSGDRSVSFGNISGTIDNSTDSKQALLGVSVSYQWSFDRFGVNGFLAYDINDSEIDGYTETGSTGLEMIYPDQDVESKTTSIGVYLNYDIELAWGLLVPNLRVAAVDESGDGSREIETELAISPGPVLVVETDDPDRSYGLVGLGLAGVLNNGQQWFVDYEQRVADDLIDDWSLSAGYLMEF